jgi:hypothetical protein
MHRKIPSFSSIVGLSHKQPSTNQQIRLDKGETSDTESERKPRSGSRRGPFFSKSRSASPAILRTSDRLEKGSEGEEDTDAFSDVCPNNAFAESEQEEEDAAEYEREEELEKNTEVFSTFIESCCSAIALLTCRLLVRTGQRWVADG